MATERILIEVTERGAVPTAQSIRGIGTAAKSSYDAVSLLKTGIATIGAGFAARELLRAADSSTALDNRIRSVTRSQTEFNAVNRETFAIAQRTRTGLEDNVTLYQRLRVATAELGISQREILDVQELINKALVVGGATSIEASNALRQLTQGLASGALRGDEFRSVSEQLPFILPLIAKQLGISTGELKKFAEQGKITTDVIISAFRNAREEIEGRFANTIPTVSQSLTRLENSFIKTIGDLNQGVGVTRALAAGINLLADEFGFLTKTLVTTAAAYATYRAAQLVSSRPFDAGTTKALEEQAVVITANIEREAQRAASAVVSARADLAATDAAIVRTEAEGALAAALASREAAERAAALPDRAAIAATDATIHRVEAERAASVVISDVAVADKAAAVEAHRHALATTEAALAEERLAVAENARLAALGRGSAGRATASGITGNVAAGVTGAGVGRIADPGASQRMSALVAEQARQTQALAEAELALAAAQDSQNLSAVAAAATDRQLIALRAVRDEQTAALAAAEANLAIEEQALVTSGLAQSEAEVQALRATRAAQAQGVAAAEAELAAVNRAVEASNIGVAKTEPLVAGALRSIRAGVVSLGNTIRANPITFLVAALAAASVAIIINRDKIRLNSESTATLGDVTDALVRRIGRANDAFLKWANEGLSKVGIEIHSLIPDVETILRGIAATEDIITGQAGLGAAVAFAKARGAGKGLGESLVDGMKGAVSQGGFSQFVDSLIKESTRNAAERLRELKAPKSDDFAFVLPAKDRMNKDEVDKARQAYERLVASVDPAIDATLKMRDAEKVLADAESAGIDPLIDKNRLLDLLRKSLSDADSEYTDYLSDLQQELDLMGMSERKRRTEGELMDFVNKRKRDNKALTDDQVAALRLYIVALDDAVEKERNFSDLQQLRSAVDPREAARQQVEAAQRTLGESVRLGNTGIFDAVQDLQRYRDANADAIDPVAALNRQHEERIRILAMSSDAQQVESEAIQRRDALIAAGIPKWQVSLDAIRRQVSAERDAERTSQLVAEALDNYGGAASRAARDLRLLEAAHAAGIIVGQAYARMLRDVNRAMLETDQSASGGAHRALIDLNDEFSDVGSGIEHTVVNAFHRASDALTDFVTKGKADVKSFVSSLAADFAQLAIEQSILRGLTKIGLSFFKSGGAVNTSAAGTVGVRRFASGDVVTRPELFTYDGGQVGVRGEAGAEAIMPLRSGVVPSVGARVRDTVYDAPIARMPNGDLGIDLSGFFAESAKDSTAYSGATKFATGGAFRGGRQLSDLPMSSLPSMPAPVQSSGLGGTTIVMNVTHNTTIQATGSSLTPEQNEALAREADAVFDKAIQSRMADFAANEMRDGGMFSNPTRSF